MISERRFSEAFGSFWELVLPWGARFVRDLNSRLETFDEPLASDLDPSTRARVNETAFRVFAWVVGNGGRRWSPPPPEALTRTWREAAAFVAAEIPGSEVHPRPEPPRGELDEAVALGRRLWSFFRERETGRPIEVGPEFRGCGLLNAARGDVLAGDALYEVKARGGKENFHLVDLRQLVVYCALDHLERRGRVMRLGLLNPRKGVFYRDRAARVLSSSSGSDPDELLTDIVEFLSSEATSG